MGRRRRSGCGGRALGGTGGRVVHLDVARSRRPLVGVDDVVQVGGGQTEQGHLPPAGRTPGHDCKEKISRNC